MEAERTQEAIHAKGFDIESSMSYAAESINDPALELYKNIKLGVKKLEDAVLDLGSIKLSLPLHAYTDKKTVYRALAQNDLEEMRNISNFYYNVSGIYHRVCNYLAFLYRYDWYVATEAQFGKVNEEQVKKDLFRILNFLDGSNIRKLCGDIALQVIINGAYYGYIVPNKKGLTVQQLPIGYCRTRFSIAGRPVVEFNMKYFDTFSDSAYRNKILKLFPDEFYKGYMMYRQGKLPIDAGDPLGQWYVLDPNSAFKFNFNGSDIPMLITSIPALIDLDAAQDLDRRKQMQKLLKIIIQKLPMDKNGDLIFDIDEARDIHNNAVKMLKRAVGVDILTTFADIESVDLSDKTTTTSTDDLAKVERAVFNAMGISQNLFNTDGNLSLEKSILNDESSVRGLLLQFGMFFDKITEALNISKKYSFKFYMLETTQYNYKELSKIYKEQTQLGYSKLLPQIALGHSQSFILNSIKFENDILHLSEIMIPPLMSSTMSSEVLLGKKGQSTSSNSQNTSKGNGNTGGRPEKANDEKSEKTIANLESMN